MFFCEPLSFTFVVVMNGMNGILFVKMIMVRISTGIANPVAKKMTNLFKLVPNFYSSGEVKVGVILRRFT